MSPAPAQSSQRVDMAVVVERLDRLSSQLTGLTEQIECLNRETQSAAVAQARQPAELEGRIRQVADDADRAHSRIDRLTQGVWAIAVPLVLMLAAYVWDLITHAP